MILLNATDISKSYTEKPLLERLSFSIHDTDKIGFIGVNGTGKSTLLRIAAGIEEADSGTVTMTKGVRIRFLSQMPVVDETLTILQQVITFAHGQDHHTAGTPVSSVTEYECKSTLLELGISDFDAPVKNLSGGEKKRVAMAGIFVDPGDLLILDEPTNHIDSDAIEWLENRLRRFKGAVFMVTHDRYFLDRVTNHILELTAGKLYRHDGNYAAYLEGKEAREASTLATERKRKTLYRRELEWIRRGAQARSTKARSRIERFEELEKNKLVIDESKLQLSSLASRLGRKVIELEHISKSYGGRTLIDDFTYTVLRNDRIGILGSNGSGKSTLLKIIQGLTPPDSGTVEIGETVRIGYFSQENESLDTSMRVIDFIQSVAYNVATADGVVTASQMLERFLFPSNMHSIKVERLSGGEKRRLYLLSILMAAPNVLLLDEPTNDLDIETLTILEDYLDHFAGAVIAVSHDRYFIDRIAIRTFFYEENGRIGHYPGGYTDCMDIRKMEAAQVEKAAPLPKKAPAAKSAGDSASEAAGAVNQRQNKKVKFSYNEQREFETIDDDIARLEQQIADLDIKIAESAASYSKLQELLEQKSALDQQLSDKMDRWVYLNDLAEQMANNY